ncbi:DsbA family protein [Stutzerimonas azotifigens]|uniref:DsbA family protein n=1 Tax=Stutzerimonas azotifigens TaxID=291995 RepID=UPI000401DE56|nr:DsbA family protein [Stutzerimonas azotifigens]
MTTRLLYVMDPMCSWCWGFAPVIEALAVQAAAEEVGLHLVVGGLRSQREPLDAAGRVRILGHWQAVNAATGQLFDYEAGMPPGFVYDTEPACRALVTARVLDPARAWPLAQAIQRAFYQQGVDVVRAAQLAELAETEGFERDAFARHFDSAEARATTEADFTWVQNLGISGFPTLLAEHEGRLALLTNGYQPLEVLAPLLDRWLQRARHG